MVKGFQQCRLTKEASALLQFVTHLGMYEPTRMPFGPSPSPEQFQRIVEAKFAWHIVNQDLKCYIDDMFNGAPSIYEAVDKLCAVLDTAIAENIRFDWSKFEIGEEIEWLGLGINKDGIHVPSDKILAVRNLAVPTNLDELRHGLGLMQFLAPHVPGFSALASVFSPALRKGARWADTWTPAMERAFLDLQQLVIDGMPLALADCSQPFWVFTDANKSNISAVLMNGPGPIAPSDLLRSDGLPMDFRESVQALQSRGLRLIACASRSTTQAEQNETVWSTTDLECLAIHWAVTEKFRDYLKYGRFTLLTDHRNLTFLKARNSDRVGRWFSNLRGYTFDIVYVPGKLNLAADAATRAGMRRAPLAVGPLPLSRVASGLPATAVFMAPSVTPASGADTGLSSVDPTALLVPFPDFHARVLAAQSAAPEEERRQWAANKSVAVEDGVYYVQQTLSGTLHRFVLLPEGNLRATALAYCHDHLSAGHPGSKGTLANLHAMGYSWPGATADVPRYVHSCFPCQLFTRTQGQETEPPFEAQAPVTGPNQRVYADILHLNTKAHTTGHDKVVVFIDAFDGFLVVAPIQDESAKSVLDTFIKSWCAYFGFPSTLDTDGGSSFDNDVTRLLMERARSALHIGTAYNSRGRGKVERAHQSILAKLRVMLQGNAALWEDLLPYVMMAINNTPSASTGLAPAHLRFTSPPRAAGHLLGTPVSAYPTKVTHKMAWLEDRLKHAEELFAQAHRMAEKQAHLRAKFQDFSAPTDQAPFTVGQWVLYHGERPDIVDKTKSKVVPFWRGPVQITAVLPPTDKGPLRYLMYDNRTGRTVCARQERVSACDVSRLPDPPAYNKVGTSRDESYVEAVLDHNGQFNTRDFRLLIRWEGWTSDFDTWEPLYADDGRGVGHLDIVKAYLEDHAISLENTGKTPAEGATPVVAAPVPVSPASPVQPERAASRGRVRFTAGAPVVPAPASPPVPEPLMHSAPQAPSTWRFPVGTLVSLGSGSGIWMVAEQRTLPDGTKAYYLTNAPEPGARKGTKHKVIHSTVAPEPSVSLYA